MTNHEQPEFYPQYCFHLSPTVGKWCHLRAADVVALSSHPGFGGQNIFFHLNHPIQWVRVSGIVTAIDQFAGRRAYTIDDGSGATMECHVLLSEVAEGNDGINLGTKADASAKPAKIIVTTPINTGDIIDVKGTIRVYRDMKQIKAEKMVLVRTTEQEVQFWEKVVKLRREVLDRPWVLDPKVVRRCRREEEGDERRRARKRTRSPSAARGQPPALVTGLERRVKIPRTVDAARHREEGRKDVLHANPMVTGLERVKAHAPKPVEANRLPARGPQERAEPGREKGTLRPQPIVTGLERKDKPRRTADENGTLRPQPLVTGLERKVKTRRTVDGNSPSLVTGLERKVNTRRTADENSAWEPGTARDESEGLLVKLKPLITGLEKGRPYVAAARPAEVKHHESLDRGQERHLPRRDNFNVASPKAKPLITGLERGTTLRTVKRPVEPVFGLQPSRTEKPDPGPKGLVTGLEKKHKTKTKQPILPTGQYSALGL